MDIEPKFPKLPKFCLARPGNSPTLSLQQRKLSQELPYALVQLIIHPSFHLSFHLSITPLLSSHHVKVQLVNMEIAS